MKSHTLKSEIRRAALRYARKHDLQIDESHTSALIFKNLCDNFHPRSFGNIIARPDWKSRTNKPHQTVAGVLEMQSSNSSDALLMNLFCHPDLRRWKGVRDLLEENLENISFGVPVGVFFKGCKADSTEIDMAFGSTFFEAKLTESDFTRKKADLVERYDNLKNAFHVEALPRVGNDYENYQVIRNILAALQHNRRHVFLCDERRPDLVRRYMQVVMSLRKINDRMNCRVIFWQDLVAACGTSLREWIQDKYGMDDKEHPQYPSCR